MSRHALEIADNRRARRVKTDRIDVENILHTLIAWCRGERHVCSMVVIPSVEERCRRFITLTLDLDDLRLHRPGQHPTA